MSYKLVVIDMDRTLLDDNKSIPEYNIKVLRILHQMGIKIIIATGRRYFFAKPALETLQIPLVVLANNGNSVWIMNQDIKISAKYLSVEVFHEILKEGHKRGLYPVLHVDHYEKGCDLITEYQYTHPAYNSYVTPGSSRHKVVENLFEITEPNVMVMCYAAPTDILKNFQDYIRQNFHDSTQSHITYSLTRVGAMLEISHISGTKWQTALEYANSVGIERSEIIAIGDDSNDLNMIENAGLGVAMKNAMPHVKEAAKIITGHDNNNAGVAHVLAGIFGIDSKDLNL